MYINDPSKQTAARVVDDQRLAVAAVTETQRQHAVETGDAYNINTGPIALTGTADSALLYFYNDQAPVNGVSDFVIDSIAVGIGTVTATITDSALITVIRNPTGGDIISDATAVDANQNSNFGSSNALASTTLVYKGKNGGTITGGSDFAYFYATGGSRLFATLDTIVPRGASVGIKIDLGTSGGGNVYAAIIGHLRDGSIGL
jgi:hypothetical protein